MCSDAIAAAGGEALVRTRVEFAVFFEREYPAVVRISWMLTGRRDVAEELAQDAFLAAHRRWERIGGYDDPAGWVRRVTINRSLSAMRRRAVEVRGLLRLSREPARATTALPDVSDSVWAALRSLPRRQVEVLVLVVVEDRSVAEVANILQCGPETVRTHLRRGRVRLAELLGVEEKET